MPPLHAVPVLTPQSPALLTFGTPPLPVTGRLPSISKAVFGTSDVVAETLVTPATVATTGIASTSAATRRNALAMVARVRLMAPA